MPLSPGAIARSRRVSRAMLEAADARAVKLAGILRRAEEEVAATVKLLASQPGAQARALDQVARLNAAIVQIAARSQGEFIKWTEYAAIDAGKKGFERQAANLARQLGVESLSEIPVPRIVATFERFEQDIINKTLLHTRTRYDMYWRNAWNERWTEVAKGVEERMVVGAARGDAWTTIASDLVDDLDQLNIRGHLPPEVFAAGFTRAKMTEIGNDMGVRFAREMGFDKFKNVGISDDRQSDECADASDLEPMTEEEWEDHELGPPPRHVLN